jgi:enamine deaminase RidA (YjgF/YER057c/UK114 family)
MAKLEQVQYHNKALEQALGFSAIVHANGLLHLAGIISIDDQGTVLAPGDIAAQVNRIYDIMEETLAKNGATLAHVVNEVMYTTDMAKLMEAVPVRNQRYEGHAFPAATAVQVVALAFPGALLEIQATAQLDGQEWSADIAPLGSPV